MSCNNDFFRLQNWYPYFAQHTFLSSFVRLRPEAVSYLAATGEERAAMDRSICRQVVSDLKLPMSRIPGNCFTSVDLCAPTDTERFHSKGGAVFSADSAWRFLCKSEKIRRSAAAGDVNFICLRPFRRINKAREFRLFVCNGELAAMSQYWLIRHFPLLDKKGRHYWKKAERLVKSAAWQLPVEQFVMDIYVTSDEELLIIDLNPWGGTTDPRLLRSWERDDWQQKPGLFLMSPPTKISGEVHVSF